MADEFNLLNAPGIEIKTAGTATVTGNADGTLIFKVEPSPGWPQLQILKLPPPPEGANQLTLKLTKLAPEKLNFGISASGYPEAALRSAYFNQQIRDGAPSTLCFELGNVPLTGIRLACKAPGKAGVFSLDSLAYTTAKKLSKGWGFEGSGDSGSFAGPAEISREYALRGKQALKLNLPVGSEVVTLFPDVTDWRPYRQLRFHLYNPKPHPNTKLRILMINGEYLSPMCSIASGILKVPPETVREFILELDTLPASVDRGKIQRIQIFKGNPETVFYLDEVKLYTAEEVERLTTGKVELDIRQAIATLDATLPTATPGLAAPMRKLRTELADCLNHRPLPEAAVSNGLTTRALELAALSGAAAEQVPLALRGAPGTERIFRDQPLSGVAAPYRISAAGNERESFQIVALPRRSLRNVTATASTLTGPEGSSIGTEHIQINPVGYIEVENSQMYSSSRAGFWPDILVHNQKLNLAERMQPYWITVYVPADRKPGIYRGQIQFTADDMEPAIFPYELEVFPFALPVRGKCLTFFDWRYTPSDPAVRRRCYDMMLDCRLNPTSMYINGNAPNGTEVPYGFHPHPDDLSHCLKRGMNMLCIWYLYDPRQPHEFSDEYLSRVKKFLNEYRPILEKSGAWDMAMINGFDEIMHHGTAEVSRRLKEARKICTWLKKDYPGIKLCNVGGKMEIPTNLMDVWFLGPLERAQFRDITDQGGKVCFYWVYDNPGPMLDLPGMAARMLAWQAFREGAGGIAYYSTYRPWALDCPAASAPTGVDWRKEQINAASNTSRTDPDRRPNHLGDGNLFYPDRDGGVLASTRIHNVRDGVEDYEYLALLRELNPQHPLLNIPDTVTTLATDDYTKDFNSLNAYRRQVAQAIIESRRRPHK